MFVLVYNSRVYVSVILSTLQCAMNNALINPSENVFY